MADEDKLTVESIRGYVLRVKIDGSDKEFPCVSVDLVMALNEIPRCSVYMAVGRSISDYKSVEDGAEIYRELIGSTKMYPCTLYEYTGLNEIDNTENDGRKPIFKGLVFQSSFDYSSGVTSSSLRVRVDCIGLAALLNILPTNLYTESSIGCIIQRMHYSRMVENTTDASRTGGFYNNDQMPLMGPAVELMIGKSILDKIAYAVSAARLAGSLADLKDTKEIVRDSLVTDAFGGNIRINEKLIGGFCDAGWCESLFKMVSTGMAQTSIYNCLHRALTSYEFGLCLAPRVSCDSKNDFKTEICTASFLNDTKAFKLTGNAVSGISSKVETLSWLNTPDVVIINFEDAASYCKSQLKSAANGVYGIASYDKDIDDKLMTFTRTGEYAEMLRTLSGKMMKVREIPAPSWLKNIMPEYANTVLSTSFRDSTGGRKQPVFVDEETDYDDDPIELNRGGGDGGLNMSGVNNVYIAANIVAHHLLAVLYRVDNTVDIDIMPSYRFGRKNGIHLENSIGKRVVVDLSDTANFGDVMGSGAKRSFYFEGTLDSVRYSWSTSPSSTVKYTASLRSVQFGDEARREVATYSKLYV